MSAAMTSIHWSGASIAGLAFSVVVFLIWLSVILGNRRDRLNKKQQARVMPEVNEIFVPTNRYSVHLKSLRTFEGLSFVGRYVGEWSEPMQNMLVFAREDGRRVMIRAEQIRFIEQN